MQADLTFGPAFDTYCLRVRRFVKRSVLFAALLVPTASAADDNAALKYQQAFYDNAMAMLERATASSPENGLLEKKTAQMLTDCHMRVMAAYSPELRETAFAVVRNGGSYLQAKDAFSGAVAIEAAAGGEREAAVKQMFDQAKRVGDECLKALSGSGG